MENKDYEIGKNEDDVKNFIDKYIETTHIVNSATFISAKWGKGKTTFIYEVIKNLPKNFKSVVISVWEEDWENKFFQTLASKTAPKRKRLLDFIFPFLTILLTTFILFGQQYLKFFENSWWLVLILSVFTSFSTVVSIAIKSRNNESLYRYLLFKLFDRRNIRNTKTILFIEDIDRLERNKLEEIYAKLSKINAWHNCQIVVTGDYELLLKKYDSNELESDLFLQKIFGRIITLPNEYQSNNIWDKTVSHYISEVNEKIELMEQEIEDIKLIKNIFTENNQTIREAIQFIELLKSNQEKILSNQINIGEFLILSYIYQFYYPLYEWIIESPKRFMESYVFTIDKDNNLEKAKAEDNHVQQFFIPNYKVIEEEVIFNSLLLKDEFIDLLIRLKNQKNRDLPLRSSSFNSKNLKNYSINVKDKDYALNNSQFQILFEDNKDAIEIFEYIIKNNLFDDLNSLLHTNFLNLGTINLDIEKSKVFSQNFINAYNKLSGAIDIFTLQQNLWHITNFIKSKLSLEELEIFRSNLIVKNIYLDLSQKLLLAPLLFEQNTVRERNPRYLNFVKEIFDNDQLIDIMTLEMPRYAYSFYFKLVEKNTAVDKYLEKIFHLNDEKFINFVEQNFVTDSSEHIPTDDKVIDLKDIFNLNNEFTNKLKLRIAEIQNDKEKTRLNFYLDNFESVYHI